MNTIWIKIRHAFGYVCAEKEPNRIYSTEELASLGINEIVLENICQSNTINGLTLNYLHKSGFDMDPNGYQTDGLTHIYRFNKILELG